ncbi:amino acid ABC transporter permease [Amphibacillus sp. Q70]|uniref:amino acid ABC transporter permease n=1 Tax=Amphibacillus sp. Q70 TaxID=3453416 RepID=UPI003F847662
MDLEFSQIVPYIPFILKGIWVTLQFVIISILVGFLLGTLLALFKISSIKPLKWFADGYTSIFRGTPLILQLMLIYYAVPQLFDYDISAFLSAVLAFGLNSAAYVSEIIRGGIQAVDRGQTEASLALGISYRRMMVDIILPQAMKNILPALMNEFITLTKESAIVSTIGYADLMRRATVVTADIFKYFEPYLFVGVLYYSMVMLLTILGRRLERRLQRSD